MSFVLTGYGRLAAVLTLLAVLVIGPGAAWAQNSPQVSGEVSPAIQYAIAPEEVVVEWDQVHDELATGETTPRLKIFGDGRFEVYYPAYMKNAGLYQGKLTSAEMSDLMSFLADKGVMEFDRASLQREKERVANRSNNQNGQLTGIMDGTITRITIRAKEYTTSGGQTKALANSEKKIQAANIGLEAEMYPDIKMLTNLSQVESRLSSMTRTRNLERMDQ